ncbi:glycosyltransferase [Selenomonas sp. AB3002]|uniref:glycosyltransferase n=1 Tax=Selenomonas sp. AB3002 TaxID=1392502 RepID=UPI00056BDED7
MQREFIIWGTGREASRLIKWISEANFLVEEILGEKACEVPWFLDSNVEKKGKKFYGREIKLPKDIWHENRYPIVIAVAQNAAIVAELEQHSYCKLSDYLTLVDFYAWLWRESGLFWQLAEALGLRSEGSVGDWWDCRVPEEISARFHSFRQDLRAACELRGHADWIEPIQDMLAMCVLFADNAWTNSQVVGSQLLDMVGISKYVDFLELVFRENVATATEWMPLANKRTMEDKLPRTIGIYYMRYYNGGIERVISKLLQLFHVHDYQLVLFTDEIKEDMEYSLPDEVKRVLLAHECGRQGRCEQLLKALQDYHVDIFCSHARGTNALYDLLCVQQAGVPVVLELHNNFSFIENMPNENILSIGRRVDVLVTLSKVDEMFWRLLGCNSVYVPNPIDPPVEVDTEPMPYTILCLQRIDQTQKQVLELPAILENVVQVLPEARLQIVGKADNPEIEARLRKMFEERGLLGNVDFLGFHTDVERYYRQASVMLMTSKFEGFPMSVAESKRYGTPLVMYELPYLELLRDGRGYIAVPQNDQKGAADALVRILSDSELRKQLSSEAKSSLEVFSKVNLMKVWENVFSVAIRLNQPGLLSEEERTFSEIERLLMQLAKRVKSERLT